MGRITIGNMTYLLNQKNTKYLPLINNYYPIIVNSYYTLNYHLPN